MASLRYIICGEKHGSDGLVFQKTRLAPRRQAGSPLTTEGIQNIYQPAGEVGKNFRKALRSYVTFFSLLFVINI